MREIKFRASDGKEMIYQNPAQPENYSVFLEGWKKEYALIVMQFTGLHDKNGKEIYEGDIAQNQYGVSYVIGWDEKRGLWGYQFLKREPDKEFPWMELWLLLAQDIVLEVIGTIHDKEKP